MSPGLCNPSSTLTYSDHICLSHFPFFSAIFYSTFLLFPSLSPCFIFLPCHLSNLILHLLLPIFFPLSDFFTLLFSLILFHFPFIPLFISLCHLSSLILHLLLPIHFSLISLIFSSFQLYIIPFSSYSPLYLPISFSYLVTCLV